MEQLHVSVEGRTDGKGAIRFLFTTSAHHTESH